MGPNPIKCTPKASPTQCKNCHSFSFFQSHDTWKSSIGCHGKKQTPTCIAKNEMPASMGIIFFWSTHHNIMPHKVPCNNTKKKTRKRKKQPGFYESFWSSLTSFPLFELGLQHHIVANVAKLEQFVMVHHLLLNDSGRKCSHYFA